MSWIKNSILFKYNISIDESNQYRLLIRFIDNNIFIRKFFNDTIINTIQLFLDNQEEQLLGHIDKFLNDFKVKEHVMYSDKVAFT